MHRAAPSLCLFIVTLSRLTEASDVHLAPPPATAPVESGVESPGLHLRTARLDKANLKPAERHDVAATSAWAAPPLDITEAVSYRVEPHLHPPSRPRWYRGQQRSLPRNWGRAFSARYRNAIGTVVEGYPARPPHWGISGLGVIPTTASVPRRQMLMSLGYGSVDAGFQDVRLAPVVSATYGLRRGEIGASYLRERVSAPLYVTLNSNYWTVHAKHRLLREATDEKGRNGEELAVGVQYIHFDDYGHLTTLYAVDSQPIGNFRDGRERLRGHYGLLYHLTRIRYSPTRPSGSFNDLRPMAGLEWFATPRLTLAVDYVPRRRQTERLMSLVARYQTRRRWSAQVGVGRFKKEDDVIFASVAFAFGKRK